jgi:hypothetical protein
MTSRQAKISTAALLGVVVIIFAVAIVLLLKKNQGPPANPGAVHGFREAALESGINWQMRFLPDEQGEKFKINLYDHGTGVAVGDYNGDGYDDIYLVNQLGKNGLFKNNGDGTFTDVTDQAGVGLGDRICAGATFADFDNSGRQSLFVTSTRGGNVLFKNNGDGTFTDITKEVGLTFVGHSQSCVFFDYDNDGFLDLLVTNTAKWTTDQFDPAQKYYRGVPSILDGFNKAPKETNILYHNVPDGKGGRRFVNVTEKAGLKGKGWSGDVAVLDYDDDGYQDLLVTNMFGGYDRTTLYHNNRDGTFTDVTDEALGRVSFGAIGCKAFDFNNDGKLDLLIVDMHSDMWMGVEFDWPQETIDLIKRGEKKKYLYLSGPKKANWEDIFRIPENKVVFGNTLFKNLGNGKFEEVSDKAGMETLWPWGIATGDFDNDGYEDVFLPSGMGFPYFYWPNYLMMNNGNETFTDRAEAAGIEPPARGKYLDEKIGGRLAARSSRTAATADFDGDGRLDLIVNNFNDTPYYFRNNFPKKNYVAFRLQGTKSNRDAIGALVRAYIGQEVMTRQVNPAGGYLSQSSKTVHFGLGDRPKIDRVEIRWPSGTIQEINDPEINKLHEIEEPKKETKKPAASSKATP